MLDTVLKFGDITREVWSKDGIPLDALRIPVILDKENVGEVDIWLDYTTRC